jgi:signal peptidase I
MDTENMKSKKSKKQGWLVRDVFDWGETVVSAVVIIVVVFTFVMRITSVDGASMNPTLANDDQLLVTNFFYTPSRGDIVVIFAPDLYCDTKRESGKDIIKRVVAVGGDRVQIDDTGVVYVNESPLDVVEVGGELYENGYLINGMTYALPPIDVTVPRGHVFVLGDNRGNSMDSRIMPDDRSSSVGFVDVNHIAGKAFFRIAPLNAFGFL